MRAKTPFFAIFFLLIISEIVLAQSSTPFVIPELNGIIMLDGKVDKPVWESVEPLPLTTHGPSFGEYVISNGWSRRAHRLLENLELVPEHGWIKAWDGNV